MQTCVDASWRRDKPDLQTIQKSRVLQKGSSQSYLRRMAHLEMLTRLHIAATDKTNAHRCATTLKELAAVKKTKPVETRAGSTALKMVEQELMPQIDQLEDELPVKNRRWYQVFKKKSPKKELQLTLDEVEGLLIDEKLDQAEPLLNSVYDTIETLNSSKGQDKAAIFEMKANKLEYAIKMIRFIEHHPNNPVALWPDHSEIPWNYRLLALNIVEEVELGKAPGNSVAEPEAICDDLISTSEKVFQEIDCARFLVAAEHPKAIDYLQTLKGKDDETDILHQDLFGLAAIKKVPADQVTSMYQTLGFDADGNVINKHFAERADQTRLRDHWLGLMERMDSFCPPFRNPEIVLPIRDVLSVKDVDLIKIEKLFWAAYYSQLFPTAMAELDKIKMIAEKAEKAEKAEQFKLLAEPLYVILRKNVAAQTAANDPKSQDLENIMAALESEDGKTDEKLPPHSSTISDLKLYVFVGLFGNYELIGTPLLGDDLKHNLYVINALKDLKAGRKATLYQYNRPSEASNSAYIDQERMLLYFLSKHYKEARILAAKIMKTNNDANSPAHQLARKVCGLCELCSMKSRELLHPADLALIQLNVSKAFKIVPYDRLPIHVRKVTTKAAQIRTAAKGMDWHPFKLRLGWSHVHDCDILKMKLPSEFFTAPSISLTEIDAPKFTVYRPEAQRKPSAESIKAINSLKSTAKMLVDNAILRLKKLKNITVDEKGQKQLLQVIENFAAIVRSLVARKLVESSLPPLEIV